MEVTGTADVGNCNDDVKEDDDDGAAVVGSRGASVADAHGGVAPVDCGDDDDNDGGAEVSVCEAVTAMEEGGFRRGISCAGCEACSGTEVGQDGCVEEDGDVSVTEVD